MNYKNQIIKLLEILTANNWKISKVETDGESKVFDYWNGDKSKQIIEECAEEVTACEEGVIRISTSDMFDSYRIGMQIILGNEPNELVCDYSYSSSTADSIFEESWNQYNEFAEKEWMTS